MKGEVMDLTGVSADKLREILAQVEAEEKAALTKVGLEFFTELVSLNTVKPSKSEDSDWFGFRVNSIGFNVDGVRYTASITVTDVKQTEDSREARKAAEKALKEAAKMTADIEKRLDAVKNSPEKYEALRATLAKVGISTEAPDAS